jgi:hypothetical protein
MIINDADFFSGSEAEGNARVIGQLIQVSRRDVQRVAKRVHNSVASASRHAVINRGLFLHRRLIYQHPA